jgi:hypothetical protein
MHLASLFHPVAPLLGNKLSLDTVLTGKGGSVAQALDYCTVGIFWVFQFRFQV